MLKRFIFTATELGLSFALMSVAMSGCNRTKEPALDEAPAFKSKAAAPVEKRAEGEGPRLEAPAVQAQDSAAKAEVNAAKTPAEDGPDSNANAKDADAMTDLMMDVPLIPREVLFGDPQRAQARLSPDGKWLSFMAPVDNEQGLGIMNVWVAPVDDLEQAKPVTKDTSAPIGSHSWAYDSKHILYTQDKEGDENFHLYATNVETKETKDLTPIDGVRGELQEAEREVPRRDARRPQRPRPAAARHLPREHRHGREEAGAAEPGRRRLPDRRRLQRPHGDQLHARPAGRSGWRPRANRVTKGTPIGSR